MNRTTRIKTAQAPRMYNIDLTDQLDGVTQTFTLEKPINEQATYYVIWNGTVYRNDPQNTWFSFNEDWDELTTYFDHAPTPGAHRSLILVVSEAADGSDVGTEVYMDSEHQDFVQIVTDENKVVSINGRAVSGISPEELQAIYDAIDDVSSDVSAVSRDLLAEVLARGNADANLQAQIDAITASSDVKDIVGTKAELDQYDTSTLGDRDIIKVLQDETQNNATTYYRWNATTSQFSLIGQEGPYYTKSAVDALLLDKADKATTYTKTEVDALISAIPQPAVFTGATSTDAGTSGLVPAPAAGDEGKYLKGDGTWDTITIPQSGIPTDATFWGASYDSVNNRVAGNIALTTGTSGTYAIAHHGDMYTSPSVRLSNNGAMITSYRGGNQYAGLNLGNTASLNATNDLGTTSWIVYAGDASTGYFSASNRQIRSLADPTAAQDAATKNYTDNLTISYAALNGSTAPTTATEGKYVGQLYYDTTNEQLYFLKEIDGTTTPATYTWEAVGGGSSVNVVQTTGTSQTDVMSQVATSRLIYPSGNVSDHAHIAIGDSTISSGNYGHNIAIGFGARATGNNGAICIGSQDPAAGMSFPAASGSGSILIGNYNSAASGANSIAIGNQFGAGQTAATGAHSIAIGSNTLATHSGSIALGGEANRLGSVTGRARELSLGSGTAGDSGEYTKYIAHVRDPQYATDAANKRYVDTAVASAGAATYTPSEFNNLWENA